MKNHFKHFSLLIIAFCVAAPQFSFSQIPAKAEPSTSATTEIHWMSFQEAVKKNETEPKKIFIDMYTAWCGWCKKMDASTFSDLKIIEYINKNYHAVKFNAETKDTIRFKDHDFFYRPEYRANELAASLMNNKMSYPTTLYLDETFTLLTPVPGYLTVDQIHPILKYFGDNIYKTKKWDEYAAELNGGGATGK